MIGIGIYVGKNSGIYCNEYITYLNAMTTEPSGADKIIQNAMFKSLIDGGYFAKMEYGYLLANHANGAGEAYINLKSPAQYKATEAVNFGNWVQYEGVIHDGTLIALDGTFNHTTHKVLTSQNNICIMTGVGTEISSNFYDYYCIDGVALVRSRLYQVIGFARPSLNDFTSGSILLTQQTM